MTALILFNVFVAIIMDAYAMVKPADHMQHSILEEAKEGFERRIYKLMQLFKMKVAARTDLEDLLQILLEWGPAPVMLSYHDIRKRLKYPLASRSDKLLRSLDPSLADLLPSEIARHYEAQGSAPDAHGKSSAKVA